LSNALLWISYFWSYLSDKGRAGFVMIVQGLPALARTKRKRGRKMIVETSATWT